MADKVIKIRGEFDASGILASFKKIRDDAAKSGVGDKILAGYDKELAKVEKLTTQIIAQSNKGLTNSNDIKEYTRTVNQLEKAYGILNVKAQDFADANNYSKENAEVRKYANQLQNLIQKQEGLKKAAEGYIDANKSSLKISEKEANQLKKSIADAQAYKKVVDDIVETKMKAAQQKAAPLILQTQGGQQKIEEISNQQKNFGFSVAARKGPDKSKEALVGKDGAVKEAEALAAAQAEYNRILKETIQTGGSADDAMKDFTKSMKGYKLEVTNADEIQEEFRKDIEETTQAALANRQGLSRGDNQKLINAGKEMAGAQALQNTVNSAPIAAVQQNSQEQVQAQESINKALEQRVAELEQIIKLQQKDAEAANQASGQVVDDYRKQAEEAQKNVDIQKSIENGFDRISRGAKQILSVTTSWRALRNVVRSTFNDIKDLDKAFGSIAMVTSYSVKDMWSQYDQYAAMANKLGQSTKSVVEASALYYQQGLKTNEVMQLTEETMKLATLANLDFKEATSQMTAALRAFHMDMNEGAHVTDVYAEVAAHAAVDVQGLSEAMSATAAIANSAGMSFENTTAMLATMVEATQEAPKNLGTAMKTILARFTELKTNVAGTADSEFDDLDYNKVDKALKSVGVNIKDATGQFKNMDEVLLELSSKWKGLDRNSQRYIATIAAGSRQQSRFIALMENYERTMELVDVAQNSAGRSSQQFAKYQDTVEYRLNKISNTWEQFKTGLISSDFYKDVLDNFNGFLNKLNDMSVSGLATLAGTWMTFGRRAISGTVNAASDLTGRIFTGKRAEEKFRANSELTGKAQDEAWENAKAEGAIKGQAIGTILSTSITSAITAGLTANDTGTAMGLSFAGSLIPNLMAGFQAAGPKGLLIGLGASIGTAVVSGIISSIKSKFEDEFKKTIEGQLKAVKNQVEKANEDLEKATSEAKTTESDLKNLEDIEKEYNSLKNKIILTEDEQKKYNDLVNNLKENYPSLISYYDEETGKIKINNQLLEDRKRTLTKLQKQQNAEVFATSITAAEASTKETELTQKKKYLENLSTAAGLSSSETTDLSKQIASYAGGSTDQLEKSITSMSDVNEQKLEEVRKILEDFKADYDNNLDKSNNEMFQQALENVKNDKPNISDTEARQRALKIQKKIADEEEFKNSEEYDKMLNFFSAARSEANTIDLLNWYNLDDDTRQDMSDFGYTKETYDKNLEGEKDLVKAIDKVRFEGKTVEGYTDKDEIRQHLDDNPDLLEGILKTSGGKDVYNKARQTWAKRILGEGITEEQTADEQKLAEEVEKLKKNQNRYTVEEFNKKIEELSQGLEEGDKKKLLAGLPLDELENYQKLLEEFGLKNDKTFQGLSSGVMEYSSQILQSLKDTFGAGSNVGEIYKEFVESIQKFNLPKDLTNKLLSFNPKDLEGQTKEDAKESLMTLFNDAINSGQITKEAAEKTAEQYLDNLEKSGIGNFSIKNASAIDAFIEKAKKKYQDTVTNYKSAIDTINSNISNGFINYLDKDKIEQAIKSLDLDPSKYLFTDKQGNYQIDVDKLNKDVQNQLTNEDEITKELQGQVKEGINQLTQKKSIINSIISQYKAEAQITKELALQREIQSAPLDSNFTDIAKNFANSWDGVTATFTQKSIEDMEAEIKAIDTQIEELRKKANDPKAIEALKKERLAAANAIKDIYKTNTKAEEDAKKALEDANKAVIDAEESRDKAYKSWQKSIEDITKKQKELNEAIKGSEFWDSGLDSMYNYTTALDTLSDKVEDAQKKMQNAVTLEEGRQAAQDYINSLAEKMATLKAEAQVYQKRIDDDNKNWKTRLEQKIKSLPNSNQMKYNLDDYLTKDKNGNTQINVSALQKAKLPDNIKKLIIDEGKALNDNQKKLKEILKQQEAIEEEFKQKRKEALQSYVDLEQKMADTLKEKYQKEIDDLKNKYSSMEEADNNYLDSLQKAIDKQRKLRDEENSWNDLANKERKLSLMRRDTSRGNAVEVKSLEKDVQKDREQLLDNAVDNIVDSLKEMYDLQKESRDAEIEYRESLLEDTQILKEVAEALKNIKDEDGLVQWFKDNTAGLKDMTDAQIQLEMENWKDLFSAKFTYTNLSKKDFEDALLEQGQHVQNVVDTTSETLTTEANRVMDQVTEQTKEAIKAAKDALEQAKQTEIEQKKAWEEAEKAAKEAKKAFDELTDKLTVEGYVVKDTSGNEYKYDNLQQAQSQAAKLAEAGLLNGSVQKENILAWEAIRPNTTIVNSEQKKEKEEKKKKFYATTDGQVYETLYLAQNHVAGAVQQGKSVTIVETESEHGLLSNENGEWKFVEEANTYDEALRKTYDSKGYRKNNLVAFAKGGLVDYTGPAWVDGSRSNPEAFLSSEDTRRIGEAARILADLPILSQPVTKDTITNNTVGDTNIQIEVNVDQIASDYDVDDAVKRVEEQIVKAAKYAGSNVILTKR